MIKYKIEVVTMVVEAIKKALESMVKFLFKITF